MANRLTQQLDPVSKEQGLPFSVKYSYDGLNRKVTETRANGAVTGCYYDDAGNITSTTLRKSLSDPERVFSSIEYDLLGNPLAVTDANGNTTAYEYNAWGKVRTITYPDDDTIGSYSIEYKYDLWGNVALKRDSMGKEEFYTYDQLGRELSPTVRHLDGSEAITTSRRYDYNGNTRYETDGNGTVKENQYDSLNRLVQTSITATGSSSQTVHAQYYTYDHSDNLLRETDWRGNTTSYEYDPLGRLISTTDANGVVVEEREYDLNHVQTKSHNIFANGDYVTTEYTYDKNNRLFTTTDPLGGVTSQTYDRVGNIRTKTDANGHVTTYEYDHYNRLISVTTPNGETSVYTYDPNGNILSQRDAASNTQLFEYNVRNLLVKRIDDGGRSGSKGKYQYDYTRIESYTYNPSGTLATKVDRNGVTTRYTYDIHGRLLSQTAGSEAITYTYDNVGNQLTITDSTGTTARTYDELGRVIVKSVPNIGVMTFEYDLAAGVPAGHVKEVTRDVKGNITEREYDKLNRLVNVTSDNETIEYQYYQDGKRMSVVYPGATETYIYYTTGHLKSLENKTSGGSIIDSYSYTYDPAGNQLSKTDAKGVTHYEYDSLNRLTKVTEPIGKVTEYTFDKAGNRKTEKVVDGATTTITTYEYNSQNRLMTLTKQATDGTKDITKYTYDHNGNMTYQAEETIKAATPGLKPSFGLIIIGQTENEMSRRVAHYVYNAFNQLVSAKTGGTTAQYVYNGEGLRVQKTVNGETTLYLYEYNKVVLELDKNGNQVARNVYGLNLLARQVDSEKYYYMYNGHADVTVLLDATSGLIAATYYYDAFGVIIEETGSIDNPIRYAGYQYDKETELYYLNARMYDPKIARFLQEDTYRGNRNDPLSLHLYAYCANNPIRYYDPTGRAFTEWDKAHIKDDFDIDTILMAGYEWQLAFEAGNQAGMTAAHMKAEGVRNKYRNTNEVGDGTGNTVLKDTGLIDGPKDGADSIGNTKTGNLPPNDAAALLALDALFEEYKSSNNASGMDATMRARQEILEKNGLPVESYTFASEDKTTRVTVVTSTTYSLDDIHSLHRRDDVLSFVGGAIPGVGVVLGPLAASVRESEQDGNISLPSTLKNIGIAVTSFVRPALGLGFSIADAMFNLRKDQKDVYYADGVVIHENDSYVLLITESAQGLNVRATKVYVRDNTIIAYEPVQPVEGHGPNPFAEAIKRKWREDGYK